MLFTGGEMVPERRAAEFEDRTGCRVLQFYGSNETGALSRTTLRDGRERRLRTAGQVIPEMHVRLLDDDGADVTAGGGPGVAACRGPLCCLGYYGDPAANEALYTVDGWMLTGDRCTLDPDGYLTVAGRASDFIIRGGKNVSAAQVEDEVSSHPAVAVAAAVAMPDPVFGERVCAYVELRPDAGPLDLTALQAHLRTRGVGKELWPEHLVVLDALPAPRGARSRRARSATTCGDASRTPSDERDAPETSRRAPGRRRHPRPYHAVVKYVVLVPDGCADEPLPELDGRTPLEAAVMPNLARLASRRARGARRSDPARPAARQ